MCHYRYSVLLYDGKLQASLLSGSIFPIAMLNNIAINSYHMERSGMFRMSHSIKDCHREITRDLIELAEASLQPPRQHIFLHPAMQIIYPTKRDWTQEDNILKP